MGHVGLAAVCAIGLGTATIAGASCSSSSPSAMTSLPYGGPSETIPGPCLAADAGLGAPCTGTDYTVLPAACGATCDGGVAYAFCNAGIFWFSCENPGSDGYTLLDDAGSKDAGAMNLGSGG